ncbi:hypothetical protein GEMRC1_013133 [Eukaryota sp. GEM-RC1]
MALDLPDTDKNIIISTDASDIAVGGVIWQEENPPAPPGTPLEERRVRPVSFYSRLLNDSQQNWAAIQKELDNGTEFANAIFEAICNLLAIEVSRSIPHFSQSNGLVERRHRDVLQSLRRLLVDFNDYDNWSTYIPTVQLQINATKSSITGHTPYELMFGSDISPGADPSGLLDAVEKSTKNVSFIDDIKMKLERLTKKRRGRGSSISTQA